MGIFDKLFNKKKEVIDFPPKPKWKPNLPNDLNLILEKAKYYTDKKIQIAVFENGTVIMFPERVSDINSSAIETLNKIYNAHPDFNPTEMDDGNYTIQYNEPAFNIVFKDEIENHWKYIDENHLDGICTAEVLINGNGEHNVFNEIGKICLFGRSKMFMDAQSPKVILTFDNLKK
ncbi:hypothetical protein ES677_15210 [Bizionia gelidisalsuginis]|uniref:Uncharacterized protein n=2 Tax=Bizionia gelidisalsuginis TaxID=291188 RepID=A0ABY3M6M8_9FLAO|nr:hypothetical protein ES677_15210 [Bizionia gelidisalsuginis]